MQIYLIKFLAPELQRFTIIARLVKFIELEHGMHPFRLERHLTTARETMHYVLPAHRSTSSFELAGSPYPHEYKFRLHKPPHKYSTLTSVLSFQFPHS